MDQTALTRIRIVLVEPAGPLNVGSIARVMKNMGLSQLVLVNPQCDPLSEDARKMAVHAADLLETATVVADLPEALTGCQKAIATTARERSLPTELENPRSALPWLLEAPAALIFGPEDRGLSNDELNYAQRFVRIPSSDNYPSLNLAQSVAICCAELYQTDLQSRRGMDLENSGEPPTGDRPGVSLPSEETMNRVAKTSPSASIEEIEAYYQQLESLLLKVGYLYPHTAVSRMEKFRRLYNRAQLSAHEVAMLRGTISQIEWALSQESALGDTL